MDNKPHYHQYSDLQEFIDKKGLPDIISTFGLLKLEEIENGLDLNELWWLYRDSVKGLDIGSMNNFDLDKYMEIFPNLSSIRQNYIIDIKKMEEKILSFNKLIGVDHNPNDIYDGSQNLYDIYNLDNKGISIRLTKITLDEFIDLGFPFMTSISTLEVYYNKEDNYDLNIDLSNFPHLETFVYKGLIHTLDIRQNNFLCNIIIQNGEISQFFDCQGLRSIKYNSVRLLKKISIENVVNGYTFDYTLSSGLEIRGYGVPQLISLRESFGSIDFYHDNHIDKQYIHSHCRKCLHYVIEEIKFVKNYFPDTIQNSLFYFPPNFDLSILEHTPSEYGKKINYEITQKFWNYHLIVQAAKFENSNSKDPYYFFDNTYVSYISRKMISSYFK